MKTMTIIAVLALCTAIVAPSFSHIVKDERIPFREAMAIAAAIEDLKAEYENNSELVETYGNAASAMRASFEYAYYSEVPAGILVEFRVYGAGSMGGSVRITVETGAFVVVNREFSR